MDPLNFINNSFLSPRPLITQLLNNPRHKKMYLAHMRTIIEEHFSNQDYSVRAQFLQNLISNDVQNDVNRFYSFNDFCCYIKIVSMMNKNNEDKLSSLMHAHIGYGPL